MMLSATASTAARHGRVIEVTSVLCPSAADGGKVQALVVASPPLAGTRALVRGRERVSVQARPHVARRAIRERVDPEQADRRWIGIEQLFEQRLEPRMLGRR